jgi:phosphopantothenoylcysteine decarboxylase/phosphopantothenate--cysteine ligase
MSSPAPLVGARVLLAVSGGIAAYKAAELARELQRQGAEVQPLLTAGAESFVTRATFAALSGRRVPASLWDDPAAVEHVALARWGELLLVAPASAHLLARMAAGLADDLVTNVALAFAGPVVVAPAMHTEMWQHPATRHNLETLAGRGVLVVPPASGPLTSGDVGPGRLAELPDLLTAAATALARGRSLAGVRVLVSLGGTREPLDPVRYLGNRSSGKQGWALARVAAARGADVVLVAANVDLPAPFGVRVVPVGTAEELRAAMLVEAQDADVVVMSAAVADFRPENVAATKLKKGSAAEPSSVPLARNPDVLAELVTKRTPGQLVVGFAAETGDDEGDVLAHGRAKLARKGCDLLVVNDVSAGQAFGRPDNAAVVLGADGSATDIPRGSKDAVAAAIWSAVAPRVARPLDG